MYRFVCVILMAVAVSAQHLKFKDCGHKEVTDIDVTGCSGDVCTVHKGEDIVFEVDFVPNQDSKTGTLDITAIIDDTDIKLSGLDTDCCHFTDCPFKKGENKVVKYKMTIPSVILELEADLKVKLYSDNSSTMACFTVHGQIRD